MALPQINYICNYNAKNNDGSNIIYPDSGQDFQEDMVISYDQSSPYFDSSDGYVSLNGGCISTFDFYSINDNPFSLIHGPLTIIFKKSEYPYGALFTCGDGDSGNEYVIYSDRININGYDFYYYDSSKEIICIKLYGNNRIEILCYSDSTNYDYSDNYFNSPLRFQKVAFFSENTDYTGTDDYNGELYWFYAAQSILSDSEVTDVIEYNEGSGPTGYLNIYAPIAGTVPGTGATYNQPQIESSSDWFIANYNDWITFSPSAGTAGFYTLTTTVAPNTGAARSDYYIQVYNIDNIDAYISIEQASGSSQPFVGNIFLGSVDVPAIYLGSTEIVKIYLGSTIVYEKSAPATITGISFTITAVNDAPASGGTISSADCTYTATANYSDGTTSDVTSQASISGYLLVESSYNTTRHSVGNLTLTASYDSYSASASTTVYQAAYVPTESYLEFNITSGGTIYWFKGANVTSKTIEYSLNGGSWTSLASAANSSTTDTNTITVVSGDKVRFRGDNSTYCVGTSMAYANRFITTATFEVYGNIMSLINSSSFANLTSFTDNYALLGLFYQQTGLASASGMVLPATTLVERCYQSMFNGCTALTTAPVLPATTLAVACYNSMFQNCSSLTTAPDLLAATLQTNCYYHLFYGCSSLTYIKCTCTTTPSGTSYTNAWTNGVASSGTFVKKSSTTWQSGANGIPSGWTIQNV